MSIPAPPGVAFLDVLASALIALLIVYLTAPSEDATPLDAEQVTFTILEGQDPDMSLVVCVGANHQVHCSTDRETGDVRFTSTSKRLSVFWPKNAFRSPPRAWVALHSFGRLPPESVRIAVYRLGAPMGQIALESANHYQSRDVLQ